MRVMSTPVTVTSSAPSAAEWVTQAARAVDGFAHRSVDEWLAACSEFLNWHRQNRLLRDAPSNVVQESDRAHAWLLRSARMIHGQMLDPDFPNRELARRVEAALWQLEEAWAQTHDPMTEAEADALLPRFFPADASGA